MKPKTNIIIILITGLILSGVLIFYYFDSCREIDHEVQRILDFDAYKFLGLEQ